jgi:hypothetical protein
MKIVEAISAVKSELKLNSNDAKPNNRFIYSVIKSKRSLIYSRTLDKGSLFNSDSWMSLYCFPLELSDVSECCGISFNQVVSKSKAKIPSTINYATGKQAIKVYTLDNGEEIQIVDLDKLINSRSQKYKSPIPDATISNGYLVVNGNILGVKLRLIPDAPEEVELANTCKTYDSCGVLIQETCPKPYLELDFNVQNDLWDAIRKATCVEIAQFYGIAYEDKENNARNDSAPVLPNKLKSEE